MGDGGVAIERVATPAEVIGRALLRPHRPGRSAARLRVPVPAITLAVAGLVVCGALAGLFALYGASRGAFPLVLAFVVGALAPSLALALDLRLRWRAEDALRRANAEMDRRVQQRTQALDEARQALVQSQKMETLGQLTGGIAHDFNNVLTAITSALEVAREAAADSRQRERLDRALEAARLGGLSVQQMLMFARNEPLHARPVDINALAEAAVAMFQRSCPENIVLSSQLAGGAQWAIADPTQVQTAILNLAVNARDAMPDGGRITIGLRRERRGAETFICILVADTGAGMSNEVQARAFEPFFSTKAAGKGTGLGLSMVRGAMRQMGGDAALVSQPGKGTIVRLWLPAANGAPPGAVAVVEAPPAPLAAAGIALIYVEDDPLVSATTAELLEAEGFTVHAAADAAHALRLTDAHPDARALLVDVGLPGMSGHELAIVARRTRPHLKVLFLSGHERCAGKAPPEDANTRYVAKPYRQQDLFTALRRLLSTS